MAFPGTFTNASTVAYGGLITSAQTNAVITGMNQTQLGVGLNPMRTLCEAMLTLQTGVPIPTTDQVGATTIYVTPYLGNRIALYDGTSIWTAYVLTSDLGLALGTLITGTNYDVFCYANAGVPTLELEAWASATTRAVDLVLQDGIPVKSGATTRRYVGSFRTTSTTTTEDSARNRLVYNVNRVFRPLTVSDATASWTYTTAAWRAANGSGGNNVSVLVGLAGATVHLQAAAVRNNASVGAGATGIGVNSTTSPSGLAVASANAASENAASYATYDGFPGLGYNVCWWLEYGSGVGTDTWYGTSSPIQSGMSGWIQ